MAWPCGRRGAAARRDARGSPAENARVSEAKHARDVNTLVVAGVPAKKCFGPPIQWRWSGQHERSATLSASARPWMQCFLRCVGLASAQVRQAVPSGLHGPLCCSRRPAGAAAGADRAARRGLTRGARASALACCAVSRAVPCRHSTCCLCAAPRRSCTRLGHARPQTSWTTRARTSCSSPQAAPRKCAGCLAAVRATPGGAPLTGPTSCWAEGCSLRKSPSWPGRQLWARRRCCPRRWSVVRSH